MTSPTRILRTREIVEHAPGWFAGRVKSGE